MSTEDLNHTYAAIDLGSNSFHMLVARQEHGELRVIDRIKEMVRLGGGLDKKGHLDPVTQDRALACLSRFGQRIRGIPNTHIRAVGTHTFRRMRNSNVFLMIAETALGCPVDIIGGREEARLIYLGVSEGVAGPEDRRLVIDIGGGSTELIIGEGNTPLATESLQFGCVSVTKWYFGNGRISQNRWQKAHRALSVELQELQSHYRQLGWDEAIGSSGTMRSVANICQAQGWCERGINRAALERLRDALIEFKTIDNINLPGLSENRKPVIAGGVVMLSACFDTLGLEHIEVSPYALREGLLQDLLGRLEHTDPRNKTIQAFAKRYGVDTTQTQRVGQVAEQLFNQLADHYGLWDVHQEMLLWAIQVHEAGLSISHSGYQMHSAYLVEHSDIAGFSRQEQLFLASLIRFHRRKIRGHYADDLPTRLHPPLRYLLVCLRLAIIFCRSRDDAGIPECVLECNDKNMNLFLDEEWAEHHPLTISDLQQECIHLTELGLMLHIHTRNQA